MAFQFCKSSYSGLSSECVEVARNIPGTVAVRDSKAPAGPMLLLAPAAWSDFQAGIARDPQTASSTNQPL
ncbi:DUF397 domain-containing protein [Streptomyces sp. NPDC088400]|uniref:DUF397 domain-containing protein n=1 Tax=Streptomyces sp. NPDC088400 TaxID=3365861 RepID=UPI0037F3AEA0